MSGLGQTGVRSGSRGDMEKAMAALDLSASRNRAGRSVDRRSITTRLVRILLLIGAIYIYLVCNPWRDFRGLRISGPHHATPTVQEEPLEGPDSIGSVPFLAETNPVVFPSVSFKPNRPLQTQEPIRGRPDRENIFHLHGEITHYHASDGWGVDEFALPPGVNITWVNVLSRHGARYPTPFYGVSHFAEKHAGLVGGVNFTGGLEFLNDWTYNLGSELLVPIGKQEMFDSGTLHFYQYAHLLPKDGTKVVARTTSQSRMLESAQYFLAGFFGLEWERNATLEIMVEDYHRITNNTLAGWGNCPRFWTLGNPGRDAMDTWADIYLVNATERLGKESAGFDWTIEDSYNAQMLCAFETISLGYSKFCNLFSYDEWLGFEYAADIHFSGNFGFQSAVGRGLGIGYVEELLARLKGQLITSPAGQVNTTLDGSEETFPTDQKLYFDFSHDAMIIAAMVAMDFRQFSKFLDPTKYDPDRDFVMGNMQPFASRLDIEVIEAEHPVPANRDSPPDTTGPATKYIHFVLNQRTLPLHESFDVCEYRDDGWCELRVWLQRQDSALRDSMYDFACHGEYEAGRYGDFWNGTPERASGTRQQ